MNVRKFIAATARDALRKVKDTLGSDAIILSNRTVPGGVEIMAVAARDMAMIVPENESRAEKREPLGEAVYRGPVGRPSVPQAGMADEDDGDYRVSLSSTRSFVQPALTPARSAVPPSPFGYSEPTSSDRAAASSSNSLKLSDLLEQDDNLFEKIDRMQEKLRARQYGETEVRAAAPVEEKAEERLYRHELPIAETIETRPQFQAKAPTVELHKSEPAAEVIPASVMEEIRSLRRIVEQNLAGFAWGETAKSEPVKTEVLRQLLDAGFSPSFTRDLLNELPGNLNATDALAWVKSIADRNLLTLGAESDIVDRGGFYALVGPTGVGKTTTTAKLAARCVLKHGPNKVALVTTDGYRIGAYEQLRIYGRILGISVHLAKDAKELRQTLAELKYKHMVLVDTMGMSQKDKMVPELNNMLTECNVRRLLLLPATSRGDTLDDIIRSYKGADLAGCILTKVDEAASLAPALDSIMRQGLKLHYVSNGQRVPEDLHLPNRAYLLHRAFKDVPESAAHHYDGVEPALMMAGSGMVAVGGKRG